MTELESILIEVERELVGFKVKERLAKDYCNKLSSADCFNLAKELFASDKYQVRSFAVFLLGNIAHASIDALNFLKNEVSRDENWRVQEILAKAFDSFCANKGYQNSLPIITEWLGSEIANVRRAVTEGLRIWTGREYFKENPTQAINLLGRLRDDPSEYVRKSVGNALRDISKKHAQLINAEIAAWDLGNRHIKQVYDLAAKFIKAKT